MGTGSSGDAARRRRTGEAHDVGGKYTARPLWPALLIGIGLAGTLDEVVLHQLLRW